jgi:hypothetical protein
MRHFQEMLLAGAIVASAAHAQGGYDGPGRYRIANVKTGKLLELNRGDQTTVVQASPRAADNQSWDIEPAGSGAYFIRNAMNARALEASQDFNGAPATCVRFDGNPRQQWVIGQGTGGAVIASHGGLLLEIPDRSVRDGVQVRTSDPGGDSQLFTLRRVSHDHDPDAPERFWDQREQVWKLAGDGACFYRQPDFRGDAFCGRTGAELSELPDWFRELFRSIKLFGRARAVYLFERPDFRGERTRVAHEERDLNRRIASLRIN